MSCSEIAVAGHIPSMGAIVTAAKGVAISELDATVRNEPALLTVPLPISEFPKWKRAIDIIAALLLLIFSSPILIAVAALVAMDGGPILYRQQRIGMGAKPFGVLKFRSMCLDAEQRLQELLQRDKRAAAQWRQHQKLYDDPRITKIGRFLRKSSLDELPQLINVLYGSMSLVGPRPIVESETIRYGHYIRHYYCSRPGITGLWQVSGRSDVSYRRRVAFDTIYARKFGCFSLDLKIIAMTIPAILFGRGAR